MSVCETSLATVPPPSILLAPATPAQSATIAAASPATASIRNAFRYLTKLPPVRSTAETSRAIGEPYE